MTPQIQQASNTRPQWPFVVCVVVFFAAITGIKLYQADFDLSSLIHFGGVFTDAAAVRSSSVDEGGYGYDGQFYYRLSIDPFTGDKTGGGIILDQPALRQQRIIYPVVAWLLSFGGHAQVIPAVLLLINLLALLGFIWLTLRIIDAVHTTPLWSLLLIASPTFLIALTRDLAELVAAFFLLLGYVLYRSKKHWLASLVFILAALTRETTIILPVAIVCYSAWQSMRAQPRKLFRTSSAYVLPVLILALWQLVLYIKWGQWAFMVSGGLNIGLPFDGMAYAAFYHATASAKVRVLEIIAMLTMVITTGRSIKKSKIEKPVVYAWIVYALLPITYSRWIWADDWTFLRAFMEVFLFGGLIVLQSESRTAKRVYLVLTVLLTVATAAKIVY